MRILCISNLFPNQLQPNRGIFNWRHFSHLQREAEVRVISPVSWIEDCRLRKRSGKSPVTSHWTSWRDVLVAYPRFYYTPGLWRNSHGTFLRISIGRCFRKAVAEFRPDLVYATWAYPDGWAAWRLARAAGLPVVVKVHGSDLLLLDGQPGRRRRAAEMLRDVNAVSAVSNDLRRSAMRLGTPPHRARVIYSGTDCDLFCPGDRQAARRALELHPEGRRLLFVGNLVEIKAVHNLVEAARRLLAKGRDFDVDIVGDGPLRAKLQQQIVEAGLPGHVCLRGPRPHTELPLWYRAADLVVLPSDSEGVPNVLVEAAACGTPFVATRVGGVPEIAHLSPGRLVPPGDPSALACAIEDWLQSEPDARTARRAAAVPSAAACAAATLSLFSEVVSSRNVNSSIADVVSIPA
jgi:glycosyltransferase involved in cell wall biosynthesis